MTDEKKNQQENDMINRWLDFLNSRVQSAENTLINILVIYTSILVLILSINLYSQDSFVISAIYVILIIILFYIIYSKREHFDPLSEKKSMYIKLIEKILVGSISDPDVIKKEYYKIRDEKIYKNWSEKLCHYLLVILMIILICFIILLYIIYYNEPSIMFLLGILSLIIALVSVGISIISFYIARESDKKMKTIGEDRTLEALGELEDSRFELRDILSPEIEGRISINIWKTRSYLERIIMLEKSTSRYGRRRKINYILLYFRQLKHGLDKKDIKFDKEAQSENIEHIEWMYGKLVEMKGCTEYTDEIDEELCSLKNDILEIIQS